jgi:prevent-host-death family protein
MMIRTIGVRQLKNEATQVVRAVREERVVYVVTVNGVPVATLRPYSERDVAGVARGEAQAEIAAIERLAAAVGEAWLTIPALPGGGGER